ncbi:AAA family ATPase [Sanguibacter sp. 4.1]|uniref:AAA family ATPase n=1 Tax=Sanguibacter biliveldensis TaxID=3030830 RepID=A0AAF0Z4H5_9MICO|nr:TOPRIM nucleotidyl transferase/hydrolase domain-containing protein [Sanguibacter sp. 4.1]WPF82677.1 AAA family ATPase [Sanguibacter sp. 4.1]
MKLTRIDVRFFRSLNYDFERRARGSDAAAPWEDTDPWLPFVRVSIEPDISAVVGANESGKSQLLKAIQAALTGDPIRREDFCRYSEKYSVESGQMLLPEFGATFQVEKTDQLANVPFLDGTSTFSLYRPGSNPPFLVIDNQRLDISASQLGALEAVIPRTFELKTGVAIPDSVSIAELTGHSRKQLHDRSQRTAVLNEVLNLEDPTAASVGALITPYLTSPVGDAFEQVEKKRREEFELARLLLLDAARIDPSAFEELRAAIAAGREGQVEAVVGAMNSAIRDNLNVQRWWSQDRDFELLLEAREYELAFIIRDRTGATYSFGERSQGLRYFLSYFVQLTAHRLSQSKPDVLLLDEPDAFLSSIGQQDLLRVLHDYALPEDGSHGSQVVYVTHSPFLIDKNAPERIRVLDKGVEDEGTRVVRDAANNRYEPLRSSLGGYVAETAFIGGQNLFVEGFADQILIAGLSAHLARLAGNNSPTLDLNEVTIVACGGADSIPYMVYLARGRDAIKPPCVALLDGDAAGKAAETVLLRGEARKKKVLSSDYIIRLDQWALTSDLHFDDGVVVTEIEDLLPAAIVHRAALSHLSRFMPIEQIDASKFSLAKFKSALKSGTGLWDHLDDAYRKAFPGEHIEKVGLAREILLLLDTSPEAPGADELRERFGALLSHLAERLNSAAQVEDQNRSDDKVKRVVKSFSQTYRRGITKREARKTLRQIHDAFSSSPWVEEAAQSIDQIRTKFEIDDNLSPVVSDFEEFREAIRALGLRERQEYQDDATKDPAATLL